MLSWFLISHMNLSQSWVSVSSSSSSSFFWIYIPATPSLRQVRIVMILSSISITLLLLRNNLISLHQSSNFILFPSDHSRSETMFLDNPIYSLFLFTGTSDVNILSIYSVVLSEASFVIYKSPSHSDNTSISCSQCWLILLSIDYATHILFLPIVKPSIILVA